MANNKSLPASQRKLRKARLDGDVAKSKDLTSIIVLIAGFSYVFYLILCSNMLISKFEAYLRLTERFSSNNMLEYAELAFQGCAGFLAKFFGIVLAVAVVVECLQVGFYFSLKPLTPNFNKLNPFDGFKKNILRLSSSWSLVVEIVKMLAVIITSISILLLLFKQYAALFVPGVSFNPSISFIASYVIVTLSMLLLLSIADFLYERLKRAKRLGMDVNEFRQEMRESDGDPHLKGMRKQLHQELGMLASLDAVRRAKILLVGRTKN